MRPPTRSRALLADRGVTKGDIVALLLPSSIDYAACYHGALRLGAVTSGVNPRLGDRERTSIFERLGAHGDSLSRLRAGICEAAGVTSSTAPR